MKKIIFFMIILLFSSFSFAKEAIWKQIYFDGVSKKSNEITDYCLMTTPGIFIGTAKDELANGAITNKNIRLNHFTFHQQKNAYGYFMYGSVEESSEASQKIWHDFIFYALRKSSLYGTTFGRWYNSQCKGVFLGYVIGWQ